MADKKIRQIDIEQQTPVDLKAVDLADGTFALVHVGPAARRPAHFAMVRATGVNATVHIQFYDREGRSLNATTAPADTASFDVSSTAKSLAAFMFDEGLNEDEDIPGIPNGAVYFAITVSGAPVAFNWSGDGTNTETNGLDPERPVPASSSRTLPIGGPWIFGGSEVD